ncbi:MAG: hypothetical protein RL204_520 [Bacteroidota bacterium]|jgi:hypothetical protein
MIRKFILRGLLFTSPILLWIAFVIISDPFNYFHLNRDLDAKEQKIKKVNSLLFNMIEYQERKTPVVFIGDSRIKALNTEEYSQLSGLEAYNLHSNAAKLNEIIDLFWFAARTSDLKHVYLGLNFNQFNEFAYSNRVEASQNMLDNPLGYVFNRSVAEACFIYYGLKELQTENQNMTADEFWKYNIETKSEHYYSRYQFPEESFSRLKEISEYCNSHNIELTFILVPHHIEMQAKVKEYNLENSMHEFKSKISELAETIDYDYDCSLNRDKSNFGDPIHYKPNIGKLIIGELSSRKFSYGVRLK